MHKCFLVLKRTLSRVGIEQKKKELKCVRLCIFDSRIFLLVFYY